MALHIPIGSEILSQRSEFAEFGENFEPID